MHFAGSQYRSAVNAVPARELDQDKESGPETEDTPKPDCRSVLFVTAPPTAHRRGLYQRIGDFPCIHRKRRDAIARPFNPRYSPRPPQPPRRPDPENKLSVVSCREVGCGRGMVNSGYLVCKQCGRLSFREIHGAPSSNTRASLDDLAVVRHYRDPGESALTAIDAMVGGGDGDTRGLEVCGHITVTRDIRSTGRTASTPPKGSQTSERQVLS